MSELDDFLAPLHQGIWEVIVPKGQVSEAQGEDWIKSSVNLPSPDTIASYRKGRYHAHETKSDWRVHMDLYDPDTHPVMHLVDDAPLLLMIAGTVESLWVDAKNTRKMDKKQLLHEQKIAWQLILFAGIFLFLIGCLMIFKNYITAEYFVTIGLPIAMVGFAIFIIFQGIRIRPMNAIAKKNIVVGIIFIMFGILALYSPAFTILLWVLFLAVWPISTAFVSLKRVRKGKIATPDGFKKRLVIGVVSIILVILFFIAPEQVTILIVGVVAIIIIMMGILLMLKGLGVRSALITFYLEENLEKDVTA